MQWIISKCKNLAELAGIDLGLVYIRTQHLRWDSLDLQHCRLYVIPVTRCGQWYRGWEISLTGPGIQGIPCKTWLAARVSRSHVTLVSWSVQLPPASELPDPNTKQSECRAECKTLKTLQRKVLIPEALQNMEIKDQGAQMEPLLPTVRDNLLSCRFNRVCCKSCQASDLPARCSSYFWGGG